MILYTIILPSDNMSGTSRLAGATALSHDPPSFHSISCVITVDLFPVSLNDPSGKVLRQLRSIYLSPFCFPKPSESWPADAYRVGCGVRWRGVVDGITIRHVDAFLESHRPRPARTPLTESATCCSHFPFVLTNPTHIQLLLRLQSSLRALTTQHDIALTRKLRLTRSLLI